MEYIVSAIYREYIEEAENEKEAIEIFKEGFIEKLDDINYIDRFVISATEVEVH